MIASTGNARVRAVTALAKKAKARREQGVFLVEGPKMFGELPVERRREVYVSENFLRQQGERAEKLLAGCRYETVTDEVMRHMSDTQTPQGILAVAEQFSYQLSDVLKNSLDGKAPELVILETLQDPGNLGTILRAGEGAGVTGIILDRGSYLQPEGHPFHDGLDLPGAVYLHGRPASDDRGSKKAGNPPLCGAFKGET